VPTGAQVKTRVPRSQGHTAIRRPAHPWPSPVVLR